MARWFRIYDEVLHDPKVQKLDGELFKSWVNILCVASQNGGKLPPMSDLSFALRMTEDATRTLVERLLNGGLIDRTSGGVDGYGYAPHGWRERQYKSDTSTDRVKRFRDRSRNVTVTPPDTDTDTEVPLSKDKGAQGEIFPSEVDAEKAFWDNAKAYLGKSKSPVIGKWVRDHGRAETARAITAAQMERVVEPIAYIERTLRKQLNNGYGEGHSGVPL